MKKAIVFGAGGFIGNHLVRRLKSENYWIRGVDLKKPEFAKSCADEFVITDLRLPGAVSDVMIADFDELYQLAADMGGAGYLFTGENDANVMYNSAMINLNTVNAAWRHGVKKIFFSSSACIYPKHNQQNPENPNCAEDSALPADPDSNYGWEKLFSERLYDAFYRNYNLDIRIARFHNVYGPEGPWTGGKEKAPAAICRKAAKTPDGETIEIWGDGKQTRSFLFIDDCVDGIRSIMDSGYTQPVNIGSEEMVSVYQLTQKIIKLSHKNLTIKYTEGPVGVRGRNSDNRLIRRIAGWRPRISLEEGLRKTFTWIDQQVKTGKLHFDDVTA